MFATIGEVTSAQQKLLATIKNAAPALHKGLRVSGVSLYNNIVSCECVKLKGCREMGYKVYYVSKDPSRKDMNMSLTLKDAESAASFLTHAASLS